MKIKIFWTDKKNGIDKGNERKFVLYKINDEENAYLFAIGCGQPNFESHPDIHDKVIQHHGYNVLGGGMIVFVSDHEVYLYGRSDHFGGVKLIKNTKEWSFMDTSDQEKTVDFLKALSAELNNSFLYYEQCGIFVIPHNPDGEIIDFAVWPSWPNVYVISC